MRTLPTLAIVASAAVVATTLAAQDTNLSLSDALSVARENSRKLRAVEQGVTAADGGIEAAHAPFLPTLTATGSYVKYDGVVFFNQFIPPAPGQPPPSSDGVSVGNKDTQYLGGIEITQNIYAGGVNAARLNASRIERELAVDEVAQAQIDLEYDVTKAYYDGLLAEKAVAVTGEDIQRLEEGLGNLKKRQAEGEALPVEVLAGETQLAAARQSHFEAENKRRLASLAINRLLNRDPDAEVRLSDPLARAAQPVSEEEAIQAALGDSPEVRKLRHRIQLSEEAINGAKAYFRPKVEVKGAATYGKNELFFEGWYYGVSANLSIPFLSDLWAGMGTLEQARARKNAQQGALDELNSGLRLQAQDAVRQVEEAYRAIPVAQQNATFHRERYRLSQVAYGEQAATYSDLLRDQSKLSEAELAVFAAQHRARLAEAHLAKVMGKH
jgi:outer membrane protein TolC